MQTLADISRIYFEDAVLKGSWLLISPEKGFALSTLYIEKESPRYIRLRSRRNGKCCWFEKRLFSVEYLDGETNIVLFELGFKTKNLSPIQKDFFRENYRLIGATIPSCLID
ncbi:MAG: hypothetical protein IJT59_01905 [Desulfovibrionaceae bacterium]|nr:hypothetical protein [Desulfovibrionaceae bacterium]